MAAQRLPRRRALAIIDDYLHSSGPHFAHLPATQLDITTFNDTIVPTNEAEQTRLVERLRPFDAIACMRERTAFPGHLLRRLPNLRLLLATGTQFETFDLPTARDLGIAVVAAPGRGRVDRPGGPRRPDIKQGGQHPTTQHAWALILALARNVAMDDAALKAGTPWQVGLARGLTGLTLGVVGLGRLGAAVARIGHLMWGMRVVCWSENLTQDRADRMAAELGLPAAIDGQKTFLAVSKAELFRSADVVSLHYVLSERSRGLVGAEELTQMRESSMLVNTSRGPLVDNVALREVLERGGIWGAALDVHDIEPLPLDSPWRKVDHWGRNGRSRLIITPHMGYMDEALIETWYAETAENVERWLDDAELLHRIA